MTLTRMNVGNKQAEESLNRDGLQWIGYILTGLYCYVSAAFGPIMPMLSEELHYSYTITAYHFSAFALGILVAGSFGDHLMRLVGRDRTLWGGASFMMLGGLFVCGGQQAEFTIFGAWLVGCAGSLLAQTITTIMADRFGESRAVAITECNIAGSLFCCAAPVLVSLCERFGCGWRAVFIFPVSILALLYFRFKTVANNYRRSATQSITAGHLPALYWAYWSIVLLSVAGEWSIVFWSTDFMMKVDHFSQADASAALSVFLVAMLIGRVVGSRLSRYYHVRQLLPISAIAGLFGFLMFWLSHQSVLNLVGLFIAGVGDASVYPMTFALAIGAASNQTNRSTCKLSLASGLANLFTPVVMGALADHGGIGTAYGVVSVLWGAVIILILVTNRVMHRRGEMDENEFAMPDVKVGSRTAEAA